MIRRKQILSTYGSKRVVNKGEAPRLLRLGEVATICNCTYADVIQVVHYNLVKNK